MKSREIKCPVCNSKNLHFSFGHVGCKVNDNSIEVLEAVLDYAFCQDCGTEFTKGDEFVESLAENVSLVAMFVEDVDS